MREREGEEGVRGKEQEREGKRKGGQEWRGHGSASPCDKKNFHHERREEKEDGAEEVERGCGCAPLLSMNFFSVTREGEASDKWRRRNKKRFKERRRWQGEICLSSRREYFRCKIKVVTRSGGMRKGREEKEDGRRWRECSEEGKYSPHSLMQTREEEEIMLMQEKFYA